MRDENLGQLELARLGFRLDALHKMQIGLFRRLVVRVARHRDVPQRTVLVQRRAQFTPINQPLFQVGGGFALRRPRFQPVVKRRDLAPIPPIHVRRHESPRLIRRQLVKWR